MGYPLTANIRVAKGATYHDVRRWGNFPYVFKPISGATNAAPLVLTVNDHDMPDGWPFAIEDVKGMLRINARRNPPADTDWIRGSVADADHIRVDSINSIDFSPYTGGGVIRYATPVDLSDYPDALFVIHAKDDPETIILTRTLGDGIEFDNTNKRITLTLTAAQTAAFDFECAEYHFDVISPDDEVTRLFIGSVELGKK